MLEVSSGQHGSLMKVRLRNNSIRLRVTQSEVRALDQGADVCSVTRLGPGNTLVFRLCAVSSHRIGVSQTSADVHIGVPAAELSQWCRGTQVSLRARQPVGSEEPLSILIEKDFACLAPRDGDDDVDCFPHPNDNSA